MWLPLPSGCQAVGGRRPSSCRCSLAIRPKSHFCLTVRKQLPVKMPNTTAAMRPEGPKGYCSRKGWSALPRDSGVTPSI